jgi:Pyridoxamine 5'-phosphate oxidase
VATFSSATTATTESYPAERRLDGATLATYLDRRAFGVVASTRRDGRPHATPISYIRRGTTFWLPTVAGSVRERNVRAQPWLVLVITEGDHDAHVAVLVEGAAALLGPRDVPPDVTALAGDWATSWLRLDAERLLSYAAAGALG